MSLTVKQLIEGLKLFPDSMKVEAWCPDYTETDEIIGIGYTKGKCTIMYKEWEEI